MFRKTLLVAFVAAASLCAAGIAVAPQVARADGPCNGDPICDYYDCHLSVYTPYTIEADDPYWDQVGNEGGVDCGRHDPEWTLRVCLQYFVRVDNQWSDLSCVEDSANYGDFKNSSFLYASDWCHGVGFGAYRIRAHLHEYYNGWWDYDAFSDQAYNCTRWY